MLRPQSLARPRELEAAHVNEFDNLRERCNKLHTTVNSMQNAKRAFEHTTFRLAALHLHPNDLYAIAHVFDAFRILYFILGSGEYSVEQIAQLGFVYAIVLSGIDGRTTSRLIHLQVLNSADIVGDGVAVVESHFYSNHGQVLSYVRDKAPHDLVQETFVHVGILVSTRKGVVEVASTMNVLRNHRLEDEVDLCALFLGYCAEIDEGYPRLRRYLPNVFISTETLRRMVVDTVIEVFLDNWLAFNAVKEPLEGSRRLFPVRAQEDVSFMVEAI